MMLVAALLMVMVTAAGGQLIPGGLTDTTVTPTDEAVVFAVQSINNQFVRSQGGLPASPLRLIQIVQARTQVVNGRLLYLTLRMRGVQEYVCNVTVLTRQWVQGPQRLSVTNGPACQAAQGGALGGGARFRRQLVGAGRQPGLVGGVSNAQPLPRPSPSGDQGLVLDALAYAACAANDQLNNRFAVTVSHTLGATYTQQPTSGITYRFYNVPIAPTNCRNQGCARLNTTACPVNQAAQERRCFFQVQYQAWLNPQYQLTAINCQPA